MGTPRCTPLPLGDPGIARLYRKNQTRVCARTGRVGGRSRRFETWAAPSEAGGEASLRRRVESSLLPHATSLLHRSEKAFPTNGLGTTN